MRGRANKPEDFWQCVDIMSDSNDCWIWQRHLSPCGRGRFRFSGIMHTAARLSYLLAVGNIPAGLSVLHKCDNPACVNPDHLFLGTQLDNMRDCKKKKRNEYGSKRYNAKLTEDDVIFAKRNLGKRVGDLMEYANVKGLPYTTFLKAWRGETWKHIDAQGNIL